MHLTRVCVKSVAVVRTTRVTVAKKLAAAQRGSPGKNDPFSSATPHFPHNFAPTSATLATPPSYTFKS